MNKFRFTFLPVFPADDINPYHSRAVGSYELAKSIMDEIARYTLHLHKEDLMHDFSNIGYIEQYENGEWIEID